MVEHMTIKLERDILRKAIEDYLAGHYERVIDKHYCKHNVFEWNSCETCIDNHFWAAIEKVDGT